MRNVAACLIVLSVLFVVAADAGEVQLQNLPGADCAPGQLKLPLVVTERSGVARRGAVVTSGVPFPPGFLHDVKKLGVVDAAGKPVAGQATVIVKWHKPVYDDSVQWALVSFVADVEANGTSTYYLTDDGKAAAPATPLTVTETKNEVRIDTGAARFVVPVKGQALISRASLGGKDIISGKGLRGIIRSGDWPDRKLKLGDLHVGTHDEAVVEESGPVRVVIAIKGAHRPGDKDGRFYDFTARLYFEAGSPTVRVIYTLRNGRLEPKLIDGWRRLYVWPIKDASLVADLALGDSTKAVTLAEGEIVSSTVGLTVHQDSSGGDKWQNLGGGNYEGWLSRYTGGKTVRGASFRGYKVTAGEKELAAGNGHTGVIDVSTGVAGVAAALRNFRVEHPSALAASAGRLRVGLFPGEFSEPFHLNGGQRKSWDVRLTLHGAEPPDLKECFAVQEALLLFRPEPAWMVRAGAAGAWPAGLALVKDPRPGRPLRFDSSKLDGIHTGWDWYGWISGYNSGGGHWNQNSVFASWVLWGDGAGFDYAEARALWAELTALHYDEPDLPTFWLMLRSWNDRENRLKRETYPGYYNRDTWGLPDSGHMGMFMWPEYYLLTGDRRAREAWEHLGIRARAFLWQYNHDDRNDGTGPLPRAINWCKKRDPDADGDFKLATRYVGWPLYDLAQYYRLTGDPKLLAECRTVARAFRNTARYSPIGFMVLQINAKGSKAVYGGQGPFEPYRSQSASQCYAHFQEGIMTTGLAEYYLMSRDLEALDTMVGFGDLMCHHAMLRDEQGKRRGWTYSFGDYWGPYSWEQAGRKATFFVSNFRVIQPMGRIYQFTGRRDFHAVLADALATTRGPRFDVIAAHMAVRHAKVDQAPPAAVADLKAEPLGGGKVKLTFTAAGDNGNQGRAAWYQVKYSTAKIVERVKGWPDRTEPQPADKKEWEARAAEFNSKQRAFWAAICPQAVQQETTGNTISITVADVPAGTCYFAIKAWDDADNVSGLSNVVEINVK